MITLSNVLPLPLQGQVQPNSQIWQCEQQFLPNRRYFVSAASGKGKTTLQHLLYGIRHDYTGSISLQWNGQNRAISTLSGDDWAAVRSTCLSVVFQDLRLFPELSVGENLLLKNQLTEHKTEADIRQLLARLEMDSFWDKKAGLLSYGQRQRVAIVRAMLQPFQMLLMDEPFAHLDSDNIRKACQLIADECAQQQAGFILASLGDRYFLEYEQVLSL